MVYPDYHKELTPELLEMGQSSWTQLVYTYGINNPNLNTVKLWMWWMWWSLYSK